MKICHDILVCSTPIDTYFNKFVVECVWEHGDADHETSEQHPFSSASEAIEFINFFFSMQETEREASGGKGFYHLPGFSKWEDFVPRDIIYSGQANPESILVYYCNANGKKFECMLSCTQ